MAFPQTRMRRLRATPGLRRLVRETVLRVEDLMCPLFVVHGCDVQEPVPSMPGVYRLSVDRVAAEARELSGCGIPAVLLFGIPKCKDPTGTGAFQDDGEVQQAVKAIKDACPEMVVATDVCLCEYTDHGHCGVLGDNGTVDNDVTLALLARVALSHARAGCDLVAPSDMMDGRVGAIRQALDRDGFGMLPIMSYAAKYASSFYGPFRDAAGSAPAFGDRRSYQMDPGNAREALREVRLDLDEGADIVMVKPALAYLDVLGQVRDAVQCPVAAYSVSGEYAMIRAAAERGWLDGDAVSLEVLTAIRRAGADIIITYAAREIARVLGG